MSGKSDDFLSRWSRRKQQAAREAASLKDKENVSKADADKTVASSPAASMAQSQAPAEEPFFDLSKLPSLDSIGPDTDVSLFLQPGVPASLSRAALRRAWSADPNIRDFIGLSENSWDFTKPESISGFGPLLPTDDVKKLLANIIRDNDVADEPTVATALQQPDTEADSSIAPPQASEINRDSVAVEAKPETQPDDPLRCTKNDPAPQQEGRPGKPSKPILGRRHGGALPT